MVDGVHLRPANGVQMHQVAVVGQKVVVGAATAFFVRDAGLDPQVEGAAVEHGMQYERVEQVGGVGRGLDVPPLVAAPDRKPQHEQRGEPGDRGAVLPRGGRCAAWGKARLAYGAVDDACHADHQ